MGTKKPSAKKPSVKKTATKKPAAKKPTVKKPRKPKAKKPTKSELLTEAAELLERIEVAEKQCQDAKLNAEACKEEYRNARNAYAERVDLLRKLCRARKEKHPLFDAAAKQTEQQPASEVKPAEKPDAKKPEATNGADDDSWRKHTLPAGGFL